MNYDLLCALELCFLSRMQATFWLGTEQCKNLISDESDPR